MKSFALSSSASLQGREMSCAKNRSWRNRFKSRRQKGPEDVTLNGAKGEKEERKGERKEISFCLLCPNSAENFHLLLLHLITLMTLELSTIIAYFI